MDDDDVVAYIYPAVGTEGCTGAAFTIRTNEENPRYLRRRHTATESSPAKFSEQLVAF